MLEIKSQEVENIENISILGVSGVHSEYTASSFGDSCQGLCVCVCHSLIDLLMSTLKETGSPSWMVPVPVLNSAAQKSHD